MLRCHPVLFCPTSPKTVVRDSAPEGHYQTTLCMPSEEAPTWETTTENTLILKGSWVLPQFAGSIGQSISQKTIDCKVIDGTHLTGFDTTGAKLVVDLLTRAGKDPTTIEIKNFPEKTGNIYRLVAARVNAAPKVIEAPKSTLIDKVAEWLMRLYGSALLQIAFFGEVAANLFAIILAPRKLRLRELTIQLERAGVQAVPIICLVTALIGVVVAYLFANQAVKYGANIFVVDAVGIGMCRELAPLIVAIIVAGRSGSAFTAQLGSMKLADEIDAIRTLGLSVMQVLIIPRVLGLVLTLPLLVLIGDIFGTLGGMFIADTFLGIQPTTFMARLQVYLPLRHVWIGLGKAPVFALFIAMVGCRLGITVEKNARSVGLNTTKTVVQSIVAVIILDAIFAVVFQTLKW